MEHPLVGIVMGSTSDLPVMKRTANTLADLGVPHEVKVLSAHRTPEETLAYARTAEERGLKVLIAGAGMAAALPGVLASSTLLPVLGVPMRSDTLLGLDALLSIVQMPGGVPVGTLAIGGAGATNAAVLAAEILSLGDTALRERLKAYRAAQAAKVLASQPD
ncbi:MAG: 5-(carboxyamino)imidazole ribonucleotide mutase [Deltaproteobacteria bacterium]|nr:5-(carboxyamino)imidazole ribonucleotide mutase [Deltaproteobacteria bacterium]